MTYRRAKQQYEKALAEVGQEAINYIKGLMAKHGNATCLDFSLLTEYPDEDDETNTIFDDEASENRANMQIDRWTRHDIWYSVYPFEAALVKGKLRFNCCESETGETEFVEEDELTTEVLMNIVDLLYEYRSKERYPILSDKKDASVCRFVPNIPENVVKEYIALHGTDGELALYSGPQWTFFDDDNNGYTDMAEKVRINGDGQVEVFWKGENSREGTWELLTDEPNGYKEDASFCDALTEHLCDEYIA